MLRNTGMFGRFCCTVSLSIAVVAAARAQTQWVRSNIEDDLRKTSFSQFVLRGKYLKAPRDQNPDALPSLIIRCSAKPHTLGRHWFMNGSFLAGYLVPGAVVDSQVVIREGLFSTSFPVVVPVMFRLDEGKLQTENWRTSTDHAAAFFGSDTFNTLLYGHFLQHKENTNEQVRKIVIGLDEAFAGEIQVQFDMPDATEVAEACGVVMHKK